MTINMTMKGLKSQVKKSSLVAMLAALIGMSPVDSVANDLYDEFNDQHPFYQKKHLQKILESKEKECEEVDDFRHVGGDKYNSQYFGVHCAGKENTTDPGKDYRLIMDGRSPGWVTIEPCEERFPDDPDQCYEEMQLTE